LAAQQLHDDEDFAAPDFVAGYAAHEWMAFQERVPDRGKIAPGGVRFLTLAQEIKCRGIVHWRRLLTSSLAPMADLDIDADQTARPSLEASASAIAAIDHATT